MFDPYIEKDVKSQVIHSSINHIRMMSDNEKLSVKENCQAAHQSVGHLTRKSEVLGWIHGLAIYFRFSFR